jgi:hypothetical protein
MLFYLATILMSFASAIAQAATPAAAVTLNAKTVIPVHLVSMLSSHDATTGQRFSFVVAKNVVENGVVIVPACTLGSGTVTLAGKHGINGHEGDLHLRFDTITTPDGTQIALDPTEQDFEGQNRKALAFFTTRYIVGNDVEIKPDVDLTVKVVSDTSVYPGGSPVCPTPSVTPTPAPSSTDR